ncbi:MAG: gamma carbonic anhydrase family protein [Zetaproteobacteria bacterium]|nr:gamma carbonic anhydrase family protein [Zetaproteobacteria bacterium]
MISAYQHWLPQVDRSAWLAASSDIIGRVTIGKDSSIWYQTVLRGDVDEIHIGERSNIQDHCTLHNSAGKPCVIGDDVTVGHRVILHGCNIQNLCLVGMGSIVMDDAVLEEGCLLAAGSLVPERKILKGGFLYAGSPARERRPLTEKEQAFLKHSAQHYVELARSHRC